MQSESYPSNTAPRLFKPESTEVAEITAEINNLSAQTHELAMVIGGKKINIPKRPGEPNSTHANITKIKKQLKWKPKVKFESGVKMMLENIDDWKKAPTWNIKKIKVATKDWFKFMGNK